MSDNLILGGPQSGYKYEFRPDGVYLTVYPSVDGERLFELSDMRQILRDHKVLDYDVGVLSAAMREANGRPQRIADAVAISSEETSAPEEEAPARIIVELPRDKMKATIRYDTRYGAGLPTKEMIMDALNEAGVVFGIDEDEIERGITSLAPFVAAIGTPPIPGENAYIDRKFSLGVAGKPVIDEYDKVDYKDLNLFVLVKENQTLAIRVEQTAGTPGKNVLGQVINAPSGRPVPMPAGKNTKVVGSHRLIATINGQIVDKGTTISVDPRLQIKGNVGVETGDISFDGSVSISGDVTAGFSVKATGDIEIKGSVNAAYVEGRNVYIRGGVTGSDRAKVNASADLHAAFAENAFLQAQGSIYIYDIALHCRLQAGNSIILSERHGQITGGSAAAGNLIEAKIIGNPSFVVTKVAVGIDPALHQQYVELKADYKKDRARLKHITQTLNTLSKIDINKLPPERVKNINALTRSQFPLAGQIKRCEQRLLEIEEQLSQMKNGKIHVSDTIYPGSRLSVNSTLKSIQTEYKRCTISLNDAGEVEVGTY